MKNLSYKIVLAIVLAIIAELISSGPAYLEAGQMYVGSWTVMFGLILPGFIVGLLGLVFAYNSFTTWIGPAPFVIISGFSFLIAFFLAGHGSGFCGGPSSCAQQEIKTIIEFIYVGTLINLLQLILLKTMPFQALIVVASWLVYSLIILPAVVHPIYFASTSHSIEILEILWQIGFYLMLVFYTHHFENKPISR